MAEKGELVCLKGKKYVKTLGLNYGSLLFGDMGILLYRIFSFNKSQHPEA